MGLGGLLHLAYHCMKHWGFFKMCVSYFFWEGRESSGRRGRSHLLAVSLPRFTASPRAARPSARSPRCPTASLPVACPPAPGQRSLAPARGRSPQPPRSAGPRGPPPASGAGGLWAPGAGGRSDSAPGKRRRKQEPVSLKHTECQPPAATLAIRRPCSASNSLGSSSASRVPWPSCPCLIKGVPNQLQVHPREPLLELRHVTTSRSSPARTPGEHLASCAQQQHMLSSQLQLADPQLWGQRLAEGWFWGHIGTGAG